MVDTSPKMTIFLEGNQKMENLEEISEHNVIPDLRPAEMRSNELWNNLIEANPYSNSIIRDWTKQSLRSKIEQLFA